ncbi:hypothetical protein D8674_004618, partial [Pyrus ussuriensis x Pyrus communis]
DRTSVSLISKETETSIWWMKHDHDRSQPVSLSGMVARLSDRLTPFFSLHFAFYVLVIACVSGYVLAPATFFSTYHRLHNQLSWSFQ